MPEFRFLEPGPLIDGDLELVLERKVPADPVKGYVPGYEFAMRSHPGGETIGHLRFRVGDENGVLRYGGHIGYDVEPAYRGHRYAARSLHLILPFARAHGLMRLWISCGPANIASRRTCELAGAALREIVDIPEEHEMRRHEGQSICRYCIEL